jgi:site-specific recombinase XerD
MMKTNESWPSESAASPISEGEGVIPAPPALKPLSAGDVSLTVADFARRSLSENTRRAYTRILKEFLAFTRTDPRLVTPQIVTGWRDELIRRKQKPATVNLKLAAVRSFYDYLHAGGFVAFNPALTKLVPPPALPEDIAGRALTPKEAVRLLAGPDRNRVEGARDHAILLTLLRLSLRVAELCSLRRSSIKWSHGRWLVVFTVKGGRERRLPLPTEVHTAIKHYLALDADRRKLQRCNSETSFIFQPLVNYRTGVFDKPLGVRMVHRIVARWGEYSGLGKLSPHDLRRTAITRALDQGLTYRQVQMMSGHKDPKTVQRYDHGRENLDQNAVNFLHYDS